MSYRVERRWKLRPLTAHRVSLLEILQKPDVLKLMQVMNTILAVLSGGGHPGRWQVCFPSQAPQNRRLNGILDKMRSFSTPSP